MQASVQFVLCWGLGLLWTHLSSVLYVQSAVWIWQSDPFPNQSHHCLSSWPSISSRATPQWSSQDGAESGFLHDWSPASKIFLPWREQPGLCWKELAKYPTILPSPSIYESLVLKCFTFVWSFGYLSMEHQLPPGMKGSQDFQWPACPVLSPKEKSPIPVSWDLCS